MQVLLATRNARKGREMARLLGSLPDGAAVKTLVDFPECPAVEEDGATFRENALIKARAAVRHAGQGWVAVADDSGLSVACLGGEPGVRSARYCGRHGDDPANNRLLLANLAGVPEFLRGARFVTAVAVVAADGREHVAEGECHGVIGYRPRGEGGFGYDSVFVRPELGKTFAEVAADVKDRLSHRGRAFPKVRRVLLEMLDMPDMPETPEMPGTPDISGARGRRRRPDLTSA